MRESEGTQQIKTRPCMVEKDRRVRAEGDFENSNTAVSNQQFAAQEAIRRAILSTIVFTL